MPKVDAGNGTPKCKCGADMVLRNGKYGKFYGCSTFPNCRNTMRWSEPEVERPAEVQPNHEIEWSDYQKAIFALAGDLGAWQHVVIQAGAGSGKTTVGVEFAARLPQGLEVAFMAFNRKIARTFAAKLPANVDASTLHSRGLSNAKNALGNVRVEGKKVWYIIKDLTDWMPFDRAEVVGQSASSIVKLVSLCKANLMEPTDANLDYIADRWNVETNGDKDVIYETAREAYRRSVEDTATIDYDDMIHLSATGRVPCKQYDVLVIDETQDLNKANLEMVVRSVKPGGHIVAVGDGNQSIYGFRGADADAMPNMIARLEAKVLPLSITYRVPRSGVALANTLVPELEAAPGAEEGILESVSEYRFLDMVRPGDLVLCRTNAPLVKPCFSLIRQGKKAVILGRDIGSGLIALVQKVQKRQRVRSLDDTLYELGEYRRKEIAKLIQQGKELAADNLDDKVETVFALSDGCGTVAELERKINDVFADEAEGVTFSTVHKSKGGEADRVFIIEPGLMPHPRATAPWEVQQERNIVYVSLTRHKKALYFVGAMPLFEVPDPDRDDDELVLDSEDILDTAISRDEELPFGALNDEEFLMNHLFSQPCGTCGGEGVVDSGALDPNTGVGIDLPCPDCSPSLEEISAEWKAKFAAREAEKERQAFLSDPDIGTFGAIGYLAGMGVIKVTSDILAQFPPLGRFEDNIYRPSAKELAEALPDYEPTVEGGQLILVKALGGGSDALVYTSIKVGEIAGGTGDDSIRVVRRDQAGGKEYFFKNKTSWITRSVPKNVGNNRQAAAAHLAGKVQEQVSRFTGTCPKCGGVTVKCNASIKGRFWWRCLNDCKNEGGNDGS